MRLLLVDFIYIAKRILLARAASVFESSNRSLYYLQLLLVAAMAAQAFERFVFVAGGAGV